MSRRPQNLVFLGLSLSSSWGNGHATTYRALLRGLAERGHEVTFLERDVPWYRENRDLRSADWCRLEFYGDLEELHLRHRRTLARADAVIVGSYVPEGEAVIDTCLRDAGGLVGFYDIDTPVTLAALDRGDCSYLAARQVPLFDIVFSFASGPALRRLEEDYLAEIALPLHCMVDERQYRPLEMSRRWSLGYLGTWSADRQPALERLLLEPARRLPNHRFVVGGSQYPDTIAWPDNVAYVGHVAPDRHPNFYCGSLFTLNLTREDMRTLGWSPSVRLFEAAACGTGVISDDWEGLDSFFPRNKAILVAQSADDVVAALEGDAAALAARIAGNARRITLERHTGRHRAAELERGLALALAHVRAERTDLPSVLTEGSKHGFRPAIG